MGVTELVALTGQRVVDTADSILHRTQPNEPSPFDPGDALAVRMDIHVAGVGDPPSAAAFETVPPPAAAHAPATEPVAPAVAVAR